MAAQKMPSAFLPSPLSLLPLYNNYSQPEIRWVTIILCAFCQKNFFFAIKLHKKKIIIAGEID
jgi:hypothetical protein